MSLFHEDHHRSSYLIVHQHGGCFLFSFVILKVMTSHESALLKKKLFKANHTSSEKNSDLNAGSLNGGEQITAIVLG